MRWLLLLLPLWLTADLFVAKDFSHLIGHSPGFRDSLLELHIGLYKGYVKNANLLSEAISDLVKEGQDRTIAYGALQRRYGWEYDGMRLHELYFGNLGGDGKLDKKSAIARKIVADFGSYDTFKQQFIATGMMRGIGWAALVLGPQEQKLHIIWVNEHAQNHLAGGTPLLVMDVWEHAYLTEFGTDRAKYIDVFFKNIDWKTVDSRLP